MNSTRGNLNDRLLERLLSMRNRHFMVMDIALLLVAPAIALILRLDGVAPALPYGFALLIYMAVALTVRMAAFYGFGLYQRMWRYASVSDVAQVTTAVAVSSAAVLLLYVSARFIATPAYPLSPIGTLPRSLPILESILVLIMIGGNRFSLRGLQHLDQRRHNGKTRRVAIMGAGDAGAMIVTEMHANPHLGMDPVAFLDDDPAKKNLRIHGVPVLGDRHQIPELKRDYNIQLIVIAMPTASGKTIREVVRICDQAGVETKIIPGMYELLGGKVTVSQLRDVEIEDLLRRDAVHTDITAVENLLQGKRVIVTGAGGSIGSELCRQIWRFAPAELILVGHGENSIFEIYHELDGEQRTEDRGQNDNSQSAPRPSPPAPRALQSVIADIRFPERIQSVFDEYCPEIVFHAAAHKHVPLMERNPCEAITNNVLGTRNVLAAAQAVGVQHFVMISTDKAVNPTSIMGASKRTAELLVLQAARRSGKPYVTVRFGNVLGSRGSAVVTFKRQIAAGGPVTVTHPDMTRYFMTIPEAVQLVLQASVLGSGGEVFMLDMGDPVKIDDLARDLIELSGFEVGGDIEIEYTGMRPGEKLFEEMFAAGEDYHRTRHEKIFIAANASSVIPARLDNAIADLAAAASADDRQAIVSSLQALLPEFQPVGESVVGLGAQPPSRAESTSVYVPANV